LSNNSVRFAHNIVVRPLYKDADRVPKTFKEILNKT